MLKKVGYVKVKDWASVFRHEELDLSLVVYVDDFKTSGPAKNIAAGWALISKVIKMEEPRQLQRNLGCEHEFTQQLVKGHFDPRLAWTVGNPPDKEQALFGGGAVGARQLPGRCQAGRRLLRHRYQLARLGAAGGADRD